MTIFYVEAVHTRMKGMKTAKRKHCVWSWTTLTKRYSLIWSVRRFVRRPHGGGGGDGAEVSGVKILAFPLSHFMAAAAAANPLIFIMRGSLETTLFYFDSRTDESN
jgi:hypothetical protein